MPLYDYRCSGCGTLFELFTSGDDNIPCPCGGTLIKTWVKAPGMSPDIQDYYDQQLGMHIKSRQHLNQVLKEKGKVAISREEAIKGLHSQPREEPEMPFDREKFQEAAQQAYWDLKNGNEPLRRILTPDEVLDGKLPSSKELPE